MAGARRRGRARPEPSGARSAWCCGWSSARCCWRSWSPRSTSTRCVPQRPPPSTLVWFALAARHGHDRHRALGLALAAGARRVRRARPDRPAQHATTSPASSSATCCRPRSAATSLRVSRSGEGHRHRPRPRSPRSRSSGSAASSRSRCSASSASSVDPSLLESSTAWVALLVSGIALAALGTILFLAGHPKAAGRFEGHENWMRFIGAAHDGVDRLRADRRPRSACSAPR